MQESNQKLENSLRLMHESVDMANYTKMELHHQGETLKRVDKNLDDIDSNLKKGEWLIKGF